MNPGLRSKSFWKLDMLKEEIYKLKSRNVHVPFVAVAESWIKPHITNAQLDIENFNIYRADRVLSKNGGTLLYINNDIFIDLSCVYDDDTCSGIICLSKKSRCIIACVYRPPSSNELSFSNLLLFINNFVESHNSSKFHIFIFGDFNFPQICWENLDNSKNVTPDVEKFFNFMDNNFLTQYVNENTRKKNLLDLFLSDNLNFVDCIKTEDVAYSDHRILKIYNTFFSPITKDTVLTNKEPSGLDFSRLNLQTSDYKAINEELSEVDWERVVDVPTNDFPDCFRNIVYKILEKHSKATSKRKTSFSRKVNVFNRKIQKTKKKLKLSNLSTKRKQSLNNTLIDLVNQKKQFLFDSKILEENKAVNKIKSDKKYFFKYANRFKIAPSSSPAVLLNKNSDTVTDPKKIADMLQSQFESVFSTPFPNSYVYKYKDFLDTLSPIPLPFVQITNKHIISAINEIKISSSVPKSEIPARVFKECKSSLCNPLKLFWQKSLDTGEIPLSYKKQTIIPLHKKGPKTLPENFRPVSLTPHEIKIIERVLREIFTEHLEYNNLINTNQHGFRRNYSCSTQLLSYTNYILSNAIEDNEVDTLYLDYSKAFDKVDHGLLIKKLFHYGIKEKYLKWLIDFLANRTQTVLVNNCYSYPVTVKSGVPQGSVLAPLLFVIYNNDIPNAIDNNSNSQVFTFADDTKLASKISSVNDQLNLQNNLNRIIEWSTSNNMELNRKKFELISHKLMPESEERTFFKDLPFFNDYQIYQTSDNTTLLPSSHVRDLGIFLDDNLEWGFHYNTISKKAKQISSWVLNTFYTRDSNTMITLFNSLVRPIVEYCCEVWSPFLIKDIISIEKIQRSFTHKIYGMKDLNYWQRLKSLNIMSLQRRREKLILIHVWKIKNKLFPNTIGLDFKLHKRSNTVQAVVKPLPKVNGKLLKGKLLKKYEGSFVINAAKLWNILPAPLTHSTSLGSFKFQLNKFLADIPDEPPLPGYPHHISKTNSLTEQCP